MVNDARNHKNYSPFKIQIFTQNENYLNENPEAKKI